MKWGKNKYISLYKEKKMVIKKYQKKGSMYYLYVVIVWIFFFIFKIYNTYILWFLGNLSKYFKSLNAYDTVILSFKNGTKSVVWYLYYL